MTAFGVDAPQGTLVLVTHGGRGAALATADESSVRPRPRDGA